jgi:ketosteroid isomerase-like protein
MRIRELALMTLVAVLTVPAWAQAAKTGDDKAGDKAAIHAAMAAQVAAWNKGDVTAFMSSYEDSPETTFVGSASVNKGFQPILSRYKANYSTREQMGTLTFKDMDIRLLPSSSGAVEYAIVTGKFHLQRKARGAQTKDDGIFSLVWRKGPDGWKIVLDHTA